MHEFLDDLCCLLRCVGLIIVAALPLLFFTWIGRWFLKALGLS